MTINLSFVLGSVLLGIGLAMDAFSVSMANGLGEPEMKRGKIHVIAGMYGLFQYLMPLIGWICVHTIAEKFTAFQKFIPWIALILLLYIGGKMLIEGIRFRGDFEGKAAIGLQTIVIQAIATSIDALSVGFTISEYSFTEAQVSTLIIGIITYLICILGLLLGRKFASKLAGKASILGGLILIGIGMEIFIKGVLL